MKSWWLLFLWVGWVSGPLLASPCGDREGSQQLACLEGMIQGIALYDRLRAETIQAGCSAASSRLDCLEKAMDGPVGEIIAQPAAAWRVEAGLGYSHGRHDGTFDIADSPLHLTSLLGGAGMTRRLGLFSPPSAKGWGWGVEYIAMANSSKARLTMPNGVNILTDPVVGSADARASAKLVFIDLMKSYPTGTGFEPYLGVGLGVGYGEASLDYSLQTAVLSPIREGHHTSSWIPALQALGGVRVDAGENMYMTLGGRMIYITGTPFKVDHQYLNLSLEGGLGARF